MPLFFFVQRKNWKVLTTANFVKALQIPLRSLRSLARLRLACFVRLSPLSPVLRFASHSFNSTVLLIETLIQGLLPAKKKKKGKSFFFFASHAPDIEKVATLRYLS